MMQEKFIPQTSTNIHKASISENKWLERPDNKWLEFLWKLSDLSGTLKGLALDLLHVALQRCPVGSTSFISKRSHCVTVTDTAAFSSHFTKMSQPQGMKLPTISYSYRTPTGVQDSYRTPLQRCRLDSRPVDGRSWPLLGCSASFAHRSVVFETLAARLSVSAILLTKSQTNQPVEQK